MVGGVDHSDHLVDFVWYAALVPAKAQTKKRIELSTRQLSNLHSLIFRIGIFNLCSPRREYLS